MHTVNGARGAHGAGRARGGHRARGGARRLLAPLAALGLLLAGTACQDEGDDGPPRFTDPDVPVEVAAGESFVLALAENPSVGHDWTLIDPEPDRAVVRPDGDGFASEDDAPGSGGTRLLRFDAVGPGETRITLTRLFRGEYEPDTDIVFDVEVVDAG